MSLIKVSQAQGRVPVTVFQLQDRINLGNTTEFEQTARNAYDIGMRDLIIDLSQAPSITSAGIRAVMVIYKMLNGGEGKHLKLVSPTSYVREVLEIAGISQQIEIFDTLEEAVASF
ncbi:MAG: STAS domain-containing protein [Chloroflexota bacterium]